ncbi:Uncharacterised protein [uncultured archaeon]|nr:Uncharacterised protein [uncultured archaeon]
MTCPEYQGETRCGFHSKFYELTQDTIEKHCKNNYSSCPEFLENNKKALEKLLSGPDFSWLN